MLHYRYTDGEPLLLDLRYLAHSGRNDLSTDGSALYKRLADPAHSMPTVQALLAWRKTHGEQEQFDKASFRISMPRGTFGDTLDGPPAGYFSSAPSDVTCLTQYFATPIETKITLALRLAEALVCLHATFQGPLLGLRPETVLVDGQDRIVIADLDAFATLLEDGRVYSGDDIVPLEFALPDDACAADGSLGREQDDFAFAISLFLLFSGGAHPFALSKAARAARNAGDAAIPERVPNRKQMASALDAQVLEHKLEWTAEAIEHLRNSLSLNAARLDPAGWVIFLGRAANLVRPITVEAIADPSPETVEEVSSVIQLPDWTALPASKRTFPPRKNPEPSPSTSAAFTPTPVAPPKRSAAGPFWIAVLFLGCVLVIATGINRDNAFRRPAGADVRAPDPQTAVEESTATLFVTRLVRVRDNPTSEGSEVLASYTRGIKVTGEWVLARDGDTKWLKILWPKGGYAYIWGRNLESNAPPNFIKGSQAGERLITSMARVRREPNELGSPIDLLSPGVTVEVAGEVAGDYLEILLPLGGVGYIQAVAVRPVASSDERSNSDQPASAGAAIQSEALNIALDDARGLLAVVRARDWTQMRSLAKRLDEVSALHIEPSNAATADNALGLSLAKARDYRGALDAFVRAYQASPAYGEARENAIYAAKMMGDYERVVDESLPALATRPANSSIFWNLGVSFAELGNAELGSGCLQAAYLVSRSAPKTLKYLLELARDGAPNSKTAARQALQELQTQGIDLPADAVNSGGSSRPDPTPLPTSEAEPPADVSLQEAPKPLKRIQPAYPLIALQNDREGKVVLKVTVGTSGIPESVEILSEQPTGYYFGTSAFNAVSQWEWNKSAKRQSYSVTINFKLS